MAFVTVYDPDGNPHQKESIDARECVANLGYSMTPKVEPVKVPEPAYDAPVKSAENEAPEIVGDIKPPVYGKAINIPSKPGKKAK